MAFAFDDWLDTIVLVTEVDRIVLNDLVNHGARFSVC
jgi:hypothetical protein